MMNFWKNLQMQILSQKKVGDIVDLSQMEIRTQRTEAGVCPLCYEPTDEELESGAMFEYNEKDLCQKHQMEMQS